MGKSEKDSRSAQMEVLQNYHCRNNTPTTASCRNNHTRMLNIFDPPFCSSLWSFMGEWFSAWLMAIGGKLKTWRLRQVMKRGYHGRGVLQLTISQQIYITSICENGNPVELPLSKRCLATDNFAQRLEIDATAEGGTFLIFSTAALPCGDNPKAVKAILFSAWVMERMRWQPNTLEAVLDSLARVKIRRASKHLWGNPLRITNCNKEPPEEEHVRPSGWRFFTVNRAQMLSGQSCCQLGKICPNGGSAKLPRSKHHCHNGPR